MTLSLPYIKALKDRLNTGQHLNVLCILNQYAPHDPVMVTAMMRHLTAHALRHARDKVGLIAKYQNTPSALLSEFDRQNLNRLLCAERASKPGKRESIIVTPHRGRRPLSLATIGPGRPQLMRHRTKQRQRSNEAQRIWGQGRLRTTRT